MFYWNSGINFFAYLNFDYLQIVEFLSPKMHIFWSTFSNKKIKFLVHDSIKAWPNFVKSTYSPFKLLCLLLLSICLSKFYIITLLNMYFSLANDRRKERNAVIDKQIFIIRKCTYKPSCPSLLVSLSVGLMVSVGVSQITKRAISYTFFKCFLWNALHFTLTV